MNRQSTPPGRVDYGIDGPVAAQGVIIASVISLALGGAVYGKRRPLRPVLAGMVLKLGVCSFVAGLSLVGGMVWSSKVGKLRARDHLIESLSLRGDESVLDVGCGRGLLLIAAAKRLTTGKAVGVDIWSAKDQSDNRPEATWANARAEGVADRVEVKDGARVGYHFRTAPSRWWSPACWYITYTAQAGARRPYAKWCGCSRRTGA